MELVNDCLFSGGMWMKTEKELQNILLHQSSDTMECKVPHNIFHQRKKVEKPSESDAFVL